MSVDQRQSTREECLLGPCLAGDEAAWQQLRLSLHPLLVGILRQRGATSAEAEDLVADLWSECVGSGNRPSLLEKFSGRCALRTWLIAVATNRLLDQRRRRRFQGELPRNESGEEPLNQMPGPAPVAHDAALTGLLRLALRGAMAQCPPDTLLLLRLVHLHGVTQREAARMWGWHESKVSRTLSEGARHIRQHTLRAVRRQDEWLQLTWDDFLDLCRGQEATLL